MDDVRIVEGGAVDDETRGRLDPPKLWFPCSFFVFLFVVCQGRGDGGRHERSGWLSEAKTQRRPHSARERECERGSFLCCFVVFVSFFSRARRRHVEKMATRLRVAEG